MILIIGAFLVTIRVSAMVVVAPILGQRWIPIYVKLLLALFISVATAPMIVAQNDHSAPLLSTLPTEVFAQIANEALIGSFIGLGILIIFSSASMIGSAIGQISGLQLDALSPNNDLGQHATTRLIALTAAVVFALSGGIEMLFSAVIDSFSTMPVGSRIDPSNLLRGLVQLLHQSFELTVRAVAPAIATLLISTLTIGLISRILPQLNLIHVGLSSNMGLMLIAVFLTLGGIVWMVIDNVESTKVWLAAFWKAGP